MFKKHILAVAVLTLTSGIAFAENEAAIEQVNTALVGSSVSVIEQLYSDNVNFAHIIQEDADGSADAHNAVVYQGVATDVGVVDSGAPAALNTTEVNLASAAYDNALLSAYVPKNDTVANFAIVKQDGTVGSQSMIVQMSIEDVSAFVADNTLFAGDLVLGTPGVSDGGGLSDGTHDLIDAGTPSALFDNVADTAANANNIAAIAQGAAVLNREGVLLGGVQGAVSTDDLALIVQLGTDNIAQIQQAGTSLQVATIIQADSGNDAYVGQYDGTANTATVVQLAVNDTATVYQSGNGNTASIYQHQ
jgi:hypothetical protein